AQMAPSSGQIEQILHFGTTNFMLSAGEPKLVTAGKLVSLGWPSGSRANQISISREGILHVASSSGLFRQTQRGWERIEISDGLGREWAVTGVLGGAFD